MTDTATRTLTVTVPIDPPAALMPNRQQGRMHWRKRAQITREYREIGAYAALNARTRDCPIPGPVEVIIHAGYGYNRRLPDLDATSSAAKAFLDGIVDAGIIYDDDQVVRWVVTHEKLQSRPRRPAEGFTRFTITEVESAS